MRKRIKKGASCAVLGKVSPKSQTENNTAKSTHAQDKTIRLGLHCENRRLIAAPTRGVFLLAVNRTHGVSLPKTLTGAPYGNPKGLLFPALQSANLYGVAHPLGGGVGFTTDNLKTGDSHE